MVCGVLVWFFSFDALNDQCFWNLGRREIYQLYDYGLITFTEKNTPGFPQNLSRRIFPLPVLFLANFLDLCCLILVPLGYSSDKGLNFPCPLCSE